MESYQPSGSGSSDQSGCSSRKRPRMEKFGGAFFDLNLPAEVMEGNWVELRVVASLNSKRKSLVVKQRRLESMFLKFAFSL